MILCSSHLQIPDHCSWANPNEYPSRINIYSRGQWLESKQKRALWIGTPSNSVAMCRCMTANTLIPSYANVYFYYSWLQPAIIDILPSIAADNSLTRPARARDRSPLTKAFGSGNSSRPMFTYLGDRPGTNTPAHRDMKLNPNHPLMVNGAPVLAPDATVSYAAV